MKASKIFDTAMIICTLISVTNYLPGVTFWDYPANYIKGISLVYSSTLLAILLTKKLICWYIPRLRAKFSIQ